MGSVQTKRLNLLRSRHGSSHKAVIKRSYHSALRLLKSFLSTDILPATEMAARQLIRN